MVGANNVLPGGVPTGQSHNRRIALGIILISFFPGIVFAQRRLRKFQVKYRSKPKANIMSKVIEANDAEAAKAKLRKQYPQCEVLSVEEKNK